MFTNVVQLWLQWLSTGDNFSSIECRCGIDLININIEFIKCCEALNYFNSNNIDWVTWQTVTYGLQSLNNFQLIEFRIDHRFALVSFNNIKPRPLSALAAISLLFSAKLLMNSLKASYKNCTSTNWQCTWDENRIFSVRVFNPFLF